MDGSGLHNDEKSNLCAVNSALQQTRHFPLLRTMAVLVHDNNKKNKAKGSATGIPTHRITQLVSCARARSR